MTTDRFAFQRACASRVAGRVLNVGANDDPAELQRTFGHRVINCDIEPVDSYLGRPNRAEVLFDARERWPFADDSADLVILGDIIEHLYPAEAESVLGSARRVSQRVCLTVPRDDRWKRDGVEEKNGYRTHCYEWTWEELQALLIKTGWHVVLAEKVDYFFVPEGYFVEAQRA